MCDTLCVANSYCCDSDINECETDNGGCTQTCDNTDGSYQCSCWVGYDLTSDGHTCTGELTVLLFATKISISGLCASSIATIVATDITSLL